MTLIAQSLAIVLHTWIGMTPHGGGADYGLAHSPVVTTTASSECHGWGRIPAMRASALMVTDDLQNPSSEREQAVLRIKKKRDLQGHLVTYLIVNVAVWVIWAATGAGYPWPAWVTGGWDSPCC